MKSFKGQDKQAVSQEGLFLEHQRAKREIARLWGKQAVSPEAFSLLLLNLTSVAVKETSKNLRKYLDAHERSKLKRVEDELFLFYLFLLDYWWSTNSKRTQEEVRIVRQALAAHLAKSVSLDTFQERLTAYAQIVTEEKDETTISLPLGRKLCEFCGMTNAFLLTSVPSLYTMALLTISELKPVQIETGKVKVLTDNANERITVTWDGERFRVIQDDKPQKVTKDITLNPIEMIEMVKLICTLVTGKENWERVITDNTNTGEILKVKWDGLRFTLIGERKDTEPSVIILNPREILELIKFATSLGEKNDNTKKS